VIGFLHLTKKLDGTQKSAYFHYVTLKS